MAIGLWNNSGNIYLTAPVILDRAETVADFNTNFPPLYRGPSGSGNLYTEFSTFPAGYGYSSGIYKFDGSNSELEVSNLQTTFNTTNTHSFFMRFKVKSFVAECTYVCWIDAGGNNMWALGSGPSGSPRKLALYYGSTSAPKAAISSNLLPTGIWVTVGFTHNQTDTRLYIDNVECSYTTKENVDTNITTTIHTLGCFPHHRYYTNIDIAWAAFYDSVRSSGDILNDYTYSETFYNLYGYCSDPGHETLFDLVSATSGVTFPRILPVGDSITCGDGGTPATITDTFRKRLQDRLGIHNYQLVGPFRQPDIWLEYDCLHAGESGKRTDEVLPKLTGYLNDYMTVPNPSGSVVLIHLGTNDCYQKLGDGTIDEKTLAYASNISGMIDIITNHDPNLNILVAKIIPSRAAASDEYVVSFNSHIDDIVSGFALPNVLTVDMYSAISEKPSWEVDLMSDDYHPNPSGYAVMGDAWYSGILLLPTSSGETPPEEPPEEPATPTRSQNISRGVDKKYNLSKSQSRKPIDEINRYYYLFQ